MKIWLLMTLFSICHGVSDEELARTELENLSETLCEIRSYFIMAYWDYNLNMTKLNELGKFLAQGVYHFATNNISVQLQKYEWQNFSDPDLKRQIQLMLSETSVEEGDIALYHGIMGALYSNATICSYKDSNNCSLHLDPHLKRIMAESRDPRELLWTWRQWRDATGKKIRKHFQEGMNTGKDTGKTWRSSYEGTDIAAVASKLWNEIKPLYVQLHAYVRRKLGEFYGEKLVPRTGCIPAHILGDMNGAYWANIEDIVLPYSTKSVKDEVDQKLKQNYTVMDMFRLSEDFFTSLGFQRLPESFWNLSNTNRILGNQMECHATAWDFCTNGDVRISMCTSKTLEDLLTIHHEMGHIYYYLHYGNQPYVYRDGANPGFHEAIGDTLTLSVLTSHHLHSVGLLDEVDDSYEASINSLMSTALMKVAFAPYAYLVDLYRWKIFDGRIKTEEINQHFWKMSEEIQGIAAPIQRTEKDFDAGSKYHIAHQVPYIRYFVAGFLQFQFHRSLCMVADQYHPTNLLKPLHKCDIYNSTAAGRLLA